MLGSEYEVLDEWFKFATNKESGIDLKVDLIIYLKTTPQKVIYTQDFPNLPSLQIATPNQFTRI